MSESLERFQQLLRELFQFDCADLDFGIYRIMNQKRDVIEQFITEDLPRNISEELEKDALAEQSQAAQELAEVAQQITKSLGGDALDADGNLAESYHGTPLGRRYISLQQKAHGALNRESLEASVYNHLYSFFSRYWQDGDFISKRRYSTKRERYSIPYNGEEVYLYWANHDQYYIKTGEYFTDYSFVAPNGVSVHFKLQTVDVEQNNVKGEKRFFVPLYEEISWKKSKKDLIVPFEYRTLTEQEKIVYGKTKQQDKIIEEALEKIPKKLSPKSAAHALSALLSEKRKNADGNSINYLEHHLRQYTKRNTSDFFIHKNLKGFLSRELDFYLKNEVLNLDELETVGEARSEGWFQLMRTIKRVGSHVIDFLHQIEEFQKMLWEKRKFITETFYCITVGNIGDEFYPEIADCEEQWEEWKTLLSIDGKEEALFTTGKSKKKKRISFLESHPTLELDTRFFSQEFRDSLLCSYEELDEKIDGLLIYSENWQALGLLLEKYRNCVKCIHIDPPYNTQTSGFLYRNNYQHSSWLAMMDNRISIGNLFLEANGHFLCHIDENEYERLKILFDLRGVADAGTIVWDKRNPMTAGRGIALQHEYVIWRSNIDGSIYQQGDNIESMVEAAKTIIEKNSGVTDEARREFREWVRKNDRLSGGEKGYNRLDDEGKIYQSVSLRAPEPRTDPKFFLPLIHPITGRPCPVPPNGFSRTPETLQTMIANGEILFGDDETTQPRQKRLLSEGAGMQIRSVIQDANKGKKYLDYLGLDFPYCHPVSLYKELLAPASSENSDIIMDYFAGSGTTGQAVIELNIQDGGVRKFILIEMAEYFDSVLLPRMKKIVYTPDWRDGKPRRIATLEEAERGPRIIKVIRLESYEDTLNNITFNDTSGQSGMQFDDYLLSYMLEWETRKSETLLNVEKLSKPFSYKLRIHADGQRREKIVDIPETFNYLLGLDVATRRVYEDKDRRYLVYRGRTRDGRNVVVIWRETEGWQKKDYERDQKFVSKLKLTEGADEVFVNGDSLIPGARALELVFKARMFAPVEA